MVENSWTTNPTPASQAHILYGTIYYPKPKLTMKLAILAALLGSSSAFVSQQVRFVCSTLGGSGLGWIGWMDRSIMADASRTTPPTH